MKRPALSTRRWAALLAVAMVALGACTYLTRPPPYRPPGIRAVAHPQTGAEWFRRDCAWCHGPLGQGTAAGPALLGGRNGPALTDFMLRTGRMPIGDPNERVQPRAPQYSPETIRKIVAYISTLGATGPKIPRPDPAAGDLALGNTLYQANCAACHSATGIGGTLTQGRPLAISGEAAVRNENRAPGLLKSTAVEIAEAMLTGPGTMPVFGTQTISASDRNAIIRYILYLQKAKNRGGGDIGRVGPVAEGAIAWVVGLGALVVFTRWLGKSVRQRG